MRNPRNRDAVSRQVDAMTTDKSLRHFFVVKCYFDDIRAHELCRKADNFGITNPYQLKATVAHDERILEKLGLSSVDIMLTLKGLEGI